MARPAVARRPPVGVVLAGGAGRRLGGEKALVEVDGLPLLCTVLTALTTVLADLAIVVKPDTLLPDRGGLAPHAQVWVEPDGPRHPARGLAHALRCADGRDVVACAVDLALLDVATVRALVAADPKGRPVTVPRSGGRVQPLCARWTPAALGALDRADDRTRMTDLVAELGPRILEVADPTPFFNVNRPEDVLEAMALRRARAAATPGATRT